MTSQPPTEPVRACVVVPTDPARAFDLYVNRPGRRHPAEGQSGNPARIVYEPFVGGRWYEVGVDGSEHEWGRVLTWDPPDRLVLAWMVGAACGEWAYDPDPWHASLAEITFEPTTDGTRVTVTHSGFERHGAGAPRIRAGVVGGWADDLADLDRASSTAHDDTGNDTTGPLPAPSRPTNHRQPPRGTTMIESGFINLYTDDMPRALHFYADTLGFRETFRVPQDEPDHVELMAPGVQIALSTSEAARTHQGVDATPGAAAGCLVLWVSDLDAAFAALAGAGAGVVSEPHPAGNGNRSALLRDPDGNLVELVAKAAARSDGQTDAG